MPRIADPIGDMGLSPIAFGATVGFCILVNFEGVGEYKTLSSSH
jgi:hypothetical protein